MVHCVLFFFLRLLLLRLRLLWWWFIWWVQNFKITYQREMIWGILEAGCTIQADFIALGEFQTVFNLEKRMKYYLRSLWRIQWLFLPSNDPWYRRHNQWCDTPRHLHVSSTLYRVVHFVWISALYRSRLLGPAYPLYSHCCIHHSPHASQHRHWPIS